MRLTLKPPTLKSRPKEKDEAGLLARSKRSAAGFFSFGLSAFARLGVPKLNIERVLIRGILDNLSRCCVVSPSGDGSCLRTKQTLCQR